MLNQPMSYERLVELVASGVIRNVAEIDRIILSTGKTREQFRADLLSRNGGDYKRIPGDMSTRSLPAAG